MSTTMKLITKQLRLVIIILFATLSLEIEGCTLSQTSKLSHSELTYQHQIDQFVVEGQCFHMTYFPQTYQKARTTCQKKGFVLARIYSTSQLRGIQERINKIFGASPFWVGASKLKQQERFMWLADNSELKRDSPLWSKGEPNNIYNRENCVEIDTNGRLNDVECDSPNKFICMALQDGLLSIKVNNIEMSRKRVVRIVKDKNLYIRCDLQNIELHAELTLTLNDEFLMKSENRSLIFHAPVMHCYHSGLYSCTANFLHKRPVMSASTSISIEIYPCPVTVTLSIDQMVPTPSHHIMTSVGSDLYFNCTVNRAKEEFYLEILKNDKVLTTEYVSSTVTFNLSVTGCIDSDVYTCRYYQLHPEMDTKSSPLFMGVHNCPTHILSFGVTQNVIMSDESDYAESELDEISGEEEFRNLQPDMSVKLVCDAETYSRPTTLLIKSEAGNVLRSQENTSFIDLSSSRMTCKDKGKVVCQITDHLRNETDTKTSYTWVRRCEPSLCHNKKHFKRLSLHLSHNVTATFCFMMDRTLHTIQEIQLFHDGRLLETNSTSKHIINIMADRTNQYQNTLDVTLVNVQVEDIGQYIILLKFNDRSVLTFFITVLVQSSSHDLSSPFMSYGLPCVIFLILILASVAIYSIVKQTKCALKNASFKGDVGQVMSEGFKYTAIREEKESIAPC